MIKNHKNAFHEELFVSTYSILQMGLFFSGLIKNHSQIVEIFRGGSRAAAISKMDFFVIIVNG